jgi:hypothetical protein|tara:strand:- start:3645 stop:3848 length:204 start_codon:yes stop_codon:yes gene_type:complete
MTIQEIMNKIKDIKANYVNGMINSEDMIECIDDLIHDVEGNDGFAFGGDEDHYASFEETDFSSLEAY